MYKKYHSKGINDLKLGQRVMKFVVDKSKKHNTGQGIIGLTCNELWDMTDEDFGKCFGVNLK